MNVETGLNRVAKVIAVMGWGWAGLWTVGALVVALLNIIGHKTGDMWAVIISAVVVAALGLGVALGLAWIIRGFAQGPSEKH